jgi:hypothetical protein
MRKFGEVRVMEADGDFTDKFYTPGEALNELFTMLVYAAHEVWMFQPMFKKKLPVPYVVQKDTLQYTFQNDTMGKFTSEYLSQPQDTTTTPLSLIYSAYKNWAQLRGCKPKGQQVVKIGPADAGEAQVIAEPRGFHAIEQGFKPVQILFVKGIDAPDG